MAKKKISAKKGKWIAELNKKFPGVISKGSDWKFRGAVPTASLTFNFATRLWYGPDHPAQEELYPLCQGGFAFGRIAELFGQSGDGKTAIALTSVANAQSLGYKVAFVDVEHAYTDEFASSLGVDTESLVVARPDNGTEAVDILRALIDSNDYKMIVFDSIGAAASAKQMDQSVADIFIAPQGQLFSTAMKLIAGPVQKQEISMVFINQERMRPGVMFGETKASAGGQAKEYAMSQRFAVTRKRKIFDESGDKKVLVGHVIDVLVKKNKLAPPGGRASFRFYYNASDMFGIDKLHELYTWGKEVGVVKASGSMINILGEKLRGIKAFYQYAEENYNAVVEEVRSNAEEKATGARANISVGADQKSKPANKKSSR